jgi:hypothetical protein
MPLDRRITGGLAWAGLLLVVGVPSADALTSLLSSEGDARVLPAVIAPAPPKVEPVAAVKPETVAVKQVAKEKPAPAEIKQVAEAEPVASKPKVATVIDPVDRYLASGKPLPAYISGGDNSPAKPQTDDISVASITPRQEKPASVQPEQIAPIPMPASMRPHPKVVAQPVPPRTAANDNIVGPEELRDWESGPLSDFLAQRQQRDAGGGAYVEYDAGEPGPVVLQYDQFSFGGY